jgi:hypothetical protein
VGDSHPCAVEQHPTPDNQCKGIEGKVDIVAHWRTAATAEKPEAAEKPGAPKSNLHTENQFIAAGIEPTVRERFVEPYNDIQGQIRDFFASKGFSYTSPRLQAEYAGRFPGVRGQSEAQILGSMNAGEHDSLAALVKERSQFISGYLSYKAEHPIQESEKNSAEMLPGSNDKLLSKAEVEQQLLGIKDTQKADALELMQKEIEAKTGRILVDNRPTGWPDLDNYFSYKTWYKPSYDDTHAHLSDAANANMQLLIEMERSYREGK